MIQVRTRKATNLQNGRRENWDATSLDGAWFFDREESPGTPWVVTHRDVQGWWGLYGSLPKARADAEGQLGWDLAIGMIHALGLERPYVNAKVWVA